MGVESGCLLPDSTEPSCRADSVRARETRSPFLCAAKRDSQVAGHRLTANSTHSPPLCSAAAAESGRASGSERLLRPRWHERIERRARRTRAMAASHVAGASSCARMAAGASASSRSQARASLAPTAHLSLNVPHRAKTPRRAASALDGGTGVGGGRRRRHAAGPSSCASVPLRRSASRNSNSAASARALAASSASAGAAAGGESCSCTAAEPSAQPSSSSAAAHGSGRQEVHESLHAGQRNAHR
mmetsp:Transcript_10389/g.24039  ORF Transcript_10389/g.24039 Transcript_10389/m.24039 type:complete len:245 (+) Transcript_10389:274-1008(+)